MRRCKSSLIEWTITTQASWNFQSLCGFVERFLVLSDSLSANTNTSLCTWIPSARQRVSARWRRQTLGLYPVFQARACDPSRASGPDCKPHRVLHSHASQRSSALLLQAWLPLSLIKYFSCDSIENAWEWSVAIQGPRLSPYEGGVFLFRVRWVITLRINRYQSSGLTKATD